MAFGKNAQASGTYRRRKHECFIQTFSIRHKGQRHFNKKSKSLFWTECQSCEIPLNWCWTFKLSLDVCTFSMWKTYIISLVSFLCLFSYANSHPHCITHNCAAQSANLLFLSQSILNKEPEQSHGEYESAECSSTCSNIIDSDCHSVTWNAVPFSQKSDGVQCCRKGRTALKHRNYKPYNNEIEDSSAQILTTLKHTRKA